MTGRGFPPRLPDLFYSGNLDSRIIKDPDCNQDKPDDNHEDSTPVKKRYF